MFKALIPYQNGSMKERIDALKHRLRTIKEQGTGSDESKILEMVQAYEELVLNIGTQKFLGKHLDLRETATFQSLNEFMAYIEEDINSLYKELEGLEWNLTSSFNINSAYIEGARAEVNRTASLMLNASLANGQPQRGMFVASDMFANELFMDQEYSDAEIGFGGGALTLKRISVEQILDPSAEVLVDADSGNPDQQSGIPRVQFIGSKKVRNPRLKLLPPYEGKLYSSPIESMRPEGGSLKFTSNGKGLAATEESDLIKARRVLLDDNPDTYWQIERVAFVDENLAQNPGELDTNLQYDFEVALTVRLTEPRVVSAFTLDPVQFGDRAYVEVLTMETSLDGQTWSNVPGLHDYNFYNILTDEANRQISAETVNAVMSPSKYSYEGKGLWVFPARQLRMIRVRLVQRTAVPTPYEVLILNQKQTVQTTKKSGSILGIGGKTKTKTKTKNRDIELSYIESLAIKFGEVDPRTEDTAASADSSSGIDLNLPVVGNIFSSGSKTTSKSGYSLHGIETAQKNNAVRYAIGIKDLGILAATFENESLYVSNDFDVPSPIRQIQLRAAYTVPDEFGEGDWVKYFVSLDGGSEWQRISAIDDMPTYHEGLRIPTTILVNSGTPEDAQDDRFGYIETAEAATKIRVRIELSKPSNIEGSPVVNVYAVQCLTEETFSTIAL